MHRVVNFFIIVLIFTLLSSCANNSAVKKSNNTLSNIDKIDSLIRNGSLDEAGELYVELKESENIESIKKVASKLAVAHIANKEYILANFYLQEGLSVDSSDEFLKFMLVKNQFLSANLHNRDQSYMKRALSALESNRYLITDLDYTILTSTMINRVKLDIAWNDKEVGNLYKRMNKIDASKLYNQKIENLGFNIDEIVKY